MITVVSGLGVGTLARRLAGIRLGRFYQYPPRPRSIRDLWHEAADNADLPIISLVTPSFNQGRFIGRTVESILGQRYPRLQYVIQDAVSTDETATLLKGYAQRNVEIRIEKDRGQADALNRGFHRTSGEIMAYLNSDDMLLPGALHLVGRYFRDHPEVDVIYGNRLVIDENDMEVGRWVLPEHDENVLHHVDYVPQESLFWRRRAWDRVGASVDSSLQFAMDWDLILRFLDAGLVFQHVPELFGLFRIHANQKTQANYSSIGASEIAIVRARHRSSSVNALKRLSLHAAYLSRHRTADMQFSQRKF